MRVIIQIGRWFERLVRRRWLDESLGRRGEELACRFLRRIGYTVVARSDRERMGEIDLVAVDGQTVVFVEVKTRRSDDKGTAAEAVDPRKQLRITRLALSFLKRHDLLDQPTRFDVVAITWPDDASSPRLEHFKAAFSSSMRWQMYG